MSQHTHGGTEVALASPGSASRAGQSRFARGGAKGTVGGAGWGRRRLWRTASGGGGGGGDALPLHVLSEQENGCQMSMGVEAKNTWE